MPTRRHDKRPRLFWHTKRDQYIIQYWHPRTGRRAWKHTHTADKAAAEIVLADFADRLGARRLGLLPWPTAGTALTIGTCVDYAVAYYRRPGRRPAPSTLSAAKLARRLLGNARAETLTEQLVVDAQTQLLAWGYAANYVNKVLQIVQHGLRLAHRYEHLPAMPKWPWPRLNTDDAVREIYVTADELARVNAHEPEAAVRDMNTWAFLTGMRLNEVRRIPWSMFDPETWTLRLPRRLSKTRKTRPLMIPVEAPELRAILARRLAVEDPACPLIFHLDGLPIGNGRWGRAWHRAGLPMRTTKTGHLAPAKVFHDLRRTGVRNLVLAGVSEKHAMQVSGHRSRAIFDRYNLSEEREIATSLATMSAYVGPLPTVPLAPPTSRAVDAARRRQLRRHAARGRSQLSVRGATSPSPAWTSARSDPSAP